VDFREFYLSLPKESRESFAAKAGTTPAYIMVHLVNARRVPQPLKIRELARAGDLNEDELALWFHHEYLRRSLGKDD
jgi:hypothetical protein